MKITRIVLPAILFVMPLSLSAQLIYSSTTIDDLDFILGEWKGELQTFHPDDPSVFSAIPASMEYRKIKNKKIIYEWKLTPPDGFPVRQKGNIEFKNGLLYFGDGYYELKEKRTTRGNDGTEWVFYRRAKEGKNKLLIKQTLSVEGSNLSLKKEIQLQGEFEYVRVSIYRMERR
ncbi:MAG: hypothetical protein SF052_03870 [Bacteroidia bacterium]|nr:hypothetical protein [Bacteroidia bacterium]